VLYLVEIEPILFLLILTPVKPRVIKVSLEVLVGLLSVGNERAAGDGAGEPRRAYIGGGRGGCNFQGIRGRNRCSWRNFTFGGGNASGYGTLGHAFIGAARHD